MNKTIYENWNGHHVKLTWESQREIADVTKVTSVHGYCFYKGKVLLADIKGRGWNTPGGHIDQDETPEEAFHREAFEEGYVKGSIQYLGAIEVSHEENPLFDPNGKYPLKGYQMFFRMDVNECLDFKGEHESKNRIWLDPEEVPGIIHDHELSIIILKEALITGEEKRHVT